MGRRRRREVEAEAGPERMRRRRKRKRICALPPSPSQISIPFPKNPKSSSKTLIAERGIRVSGLLSNSNSLVETMVEGTKQVVTGEAGSVGYLHFYGCDVGNLGSGEGSDERSVVVSEETNKWEMSRCVIDVEKTMKKSEFIYGEKEKERFSRILKR
ncbi:hypothetical protein Droror1_Dr00017352 [Drosera rotundifolia]